MINNALLFDEENFLLSHLGNAAIEPVRLGAIPTRCLAQLLEAGGEVVRKRDLIDGAWGQYGFEVTENSLAQVIRHLRLSLEKLDPGREHIQTLPRIGYKLAEGMALRAVEDSSAIPADLPGAAPESTGQEHSGTEPTSPAAGFSKFRAKAYNSLVLRLGLLVIWSVGIFFAAEYWQAQQIPYADIQFGPPQERGSMKIYLPASVQIPESRVQKVTHTATQLLSFLHIQPDSADLYLLPSYEGRHSIICIGPIESEGSRCIGIDVDD